MLSARYDVIVLGVGAMGSATVYQLARRGKRVLGLERYDIPHAMGSSHGHTRIIRLAYYEDPSYVMLLQRSYELWRSIQARAGERLLHITGSVDAGPSNSWVFKGSLQSCLQHELPHQVLTSKELAERFPGYRLPHETLAVLQPEGGFLLPERCIVAYVTAAQAEGAEVHGRERVLEWLPLGDGVRVITDHGVYETDQLEREPRRDDEELLRGFAARYFPGGSGPTMSLAVCMFTNTSDNHFVIDLHPDYPQVSFASPCSGHGFKFASVIGEIMADLAERGTTRHNIELFRLDRLLGGARGR